MPFILIGFDVPLVCCLSRLWCVYAVHSNWIWCPNSVLSIQIMMCLCRSF